jgi:tetratricopeptide (TPR) repeat protein
LDALALYAKARSAQWTGRLTLAVESLRKAIELDPGRFELHRALGEVYRGMTGRLDDALEAFLHASEIIPDDADTQFQVGRILLLRNRYEEAVERLRLARTHVNPSDGVLAASIDYSLAAALRQAGYDRAAMEVYQSLANRIARPSLPMRTSPETAALIARPHVVQFEIGRLAERIGEFETALNSYRVVAAAQPSNFDAQERVVRMLLANGRIDDALREAADLTRRFRGSTASLALLRQTFELVGKSDRIVATLRKLLEEQPSNPSILLALVDQLDVAGKPAEADKLMRDRLATPQANWELVRRHFARLSQRGATDEAAKLLIEWTTDHPDDADEVGERFGELMRPDRRARLRIASIQQMKLEERHEAARLYWVSRIAQSWQRDALAQDSLRRSAELRPLLAPAARAWLDRVWSRDDLSEAEKLDRAEALMRAAEEDGNPSLARELRGLVFLRQGRISESAQELDAAAQLRSSPSASLNTARAIVALRLGNETRFEQLLWQVVSDHPLYHPAYTALLEHYESKRTDRFMLVLQKWLAADPGSVYARLRQAQVLFARREVEATRRLLAELFDDNPDSAIVLANIRAFYTAQRDIPGLVSFLEDRRTRQPGNRLIAETLVEVYTESGRAADAVGVIDQLREASGGDPDLLYSMAHLYQRVGKEEAMWETLQKVLQIDPNHSSANNDLGYTWADKSMNLDLAEQYVRRAVQAEPDNQSYLDSLAWVLYKRGQFDEALVHLQKAVGPSEFPDPIILDHLGDTLQRLGRTSEAEKYWQMASERIRPSPARPDLQKLAGELVRKLDAVRSGKPVEVAPTAAETLADRPIPEVVP